MKILPDFARDMDLLTLSPDGSQLAAASHEGKTTVWNLQTGKQMWLQTSNAGISNPIEDTDRLAKLLFSPNGKRLLTARDRLLGVEVWDIATKCKLAAIPPGGHATACVAFWDEGRKVATLDTSNFENRSIFVWNLPH